MHPRVIAERNADATLRIRGAVQFLAEQYGIEAPDLIVRGQVGGPEVARLKEREAVADFLMQLVSASPDAAPEAEANQSDGEPAVHRRRRKES